MEASDLFHSASPYGQRSTAHVNSVDNFGHVKKWQSSSKPVPSRIPDHIQGSTFVADSNENHYGRKWKRVIDPNDQLGLGRYESAPGGERTSQRKRSELAGHEDAPREAFFGPSGEMGALSISDNRPKTGLRQCHMHTDQSLSNPGGVNGILAGAGDAEIPWKTKRHIEPKLSNHLEKPGAVTTNGNGTISWNSPERRKVQNQARPQMHSAEESYRTLRKQVPSPAGPSTRLIFQDMDDDVPHTPIRRQQPYRETVVAVSSRDKGPNARAPAPKSPGRISESGALSGAGLRPSMRHTDAWEAHTPSRKRFVDPSANTALGAAGAPFGLHGDRP